MHSMTHWLRHTMEFSLNIKIKHKIREIIIKEVVGLV